MDMGLLAEVTRGNMVESRHIGRAIVVDSEGSIVWSASVPDSLIYPRSTIKAFLALELVASGAAQRLGLEDNALALACASHGGEESHTDLVRQMLARVGRDEGSLECGAHWPLYPPAARSWAGCGHRDPCAAQNTCSGKHAGLICLACDQKIDPSGYIAPDHVLQKRVTSVLEEVTQAAHLPEHCGIDGCSLPTYAIPLKNLAWGLARFATGHGLAGPLAEAAGKLRGAVAACPLMVAGHDRYDTQVMEHFGERVFVKMGAEGIMVAALPEEGLGLVVKAEDGAGRAAEVAMTALLARFGGKAVTSRQEDVMFLHHYANQPLVNWQGREVGLLRAAF